MRDVWIVLVGVGAGALLSVFIQWVTHRYAKKQRRQHLILVVCSVLDDFIVTCQEAIADGGKRSPEGKREFSVPTPTPPSFSAEVDWTTIDQDLLRRFLSLRFAIAKAREQLGEQLPFIAFHEDVAPHYPATFDFRRKKCAEWLQEASELSDAFRKRAKPPIWEAVSDP